LNSKTEDNAAPRPDPDPDRDAFRAAVSSGNTDRIRSTVRRFMSRTTSSARAAKFVRTVIQQNKPLDFRPVRLAFLSSFSIEFVHDHVFAHACTEGLMLNLYQSGFDQYHQEILDPDSGLYRFQPDLIVLAVDGMRWAPELYGEFLRVDNTEKDAVVDSTISKVAGLLTELRQRTNAPVLLHSFPYPRHPALGILDINYPKGQREAIFRVNHKLASLVRDLKGVFLVDIDALIQSAGHDQWYDPRLEFFARSPIGRSAVDLLARTYVRYLRALNGYSRKCVIVDLDNTLWGGLAGEDGAQGIKLGSEYPGNAYVAFQQTLGRLRDKGVLLAIASRNNAADVEEIFARNTAMVLELEHFSAREIHWEPKSKSVARIATALNLDLRHLVFVDDDPAECAEVEETYPQVTVIALPEQPERYVEALLSEGLFDTLTFSSEDSRRGELYLQRDAAERLRSYASSLEDYYRSLEMRIRLGSLDAHTIERAAQMTQKTNQFNATTKRYTEADLLARSQKENWVCITMRLSDKFGDNGIVGLMLAERKADVVDIDTFLMSCRVINRTAESVLLDWLASRARILGLTAIEGRIIPTARNIPVRDLYARHGFKAVKSEPDEQGTRWRLNLGENLPAPPPWFQIIDETSHDRPAE
jgi:FkbH-like protein